MADKNKKQSMDDFAKEYLAGFEKWKEQHAKWREEREKTVEKMAGVIFDYVRNDAVARVIASALVGKGYGGNLEDFSTDCLNYNTELLGKARQIEHLEWRVEQLSAELSSETDEHRKFVCEVAEKIEAARKQIAKEILEEVSKHYGGVWLVELYKRYGVEVDV